ncbi:hypothetical protein DSO57_1013708 [Entomophthora muscae]|uniref:Uncharacterized protein n=1 Tax=Entomophthora muscae TaxID=34485 RepID=A0ACC2TGD2_9FUNG|nr:hypothetical protein DSO57_1013708 [Entomophthora muscae]
MEPNEQWDLETVGPLSKNKLGKKYLATAINHFAFWPMAWEAINNAGTTTCYIGQEIVVQFSQLKKPATDGFSEFVVYYVKNALNVINDISILVLKTQEMNPSSLKAD